MTALRMELDRNDQLVRPARREILARRFMLGCGVFSSLLYAAMLVVVATRWQGYSSISQTVSELSAIGAPTRSLWVALSMLYGLLVTVFARGVCRAAGPDRALRTTGWLLLAYGVLGFFWPPMHLRGSELTLTDSMHIAFAIATVLIMLLAIGFGAATLGKWFRWYSIVTVMVFVVFGTLAGADGPRVAANLPTPWVGVWERINIGAFLLWIVVVAVTLLRRTPSLGTPSGS
ncbi:MAG TPA: DUF998 domain-containing protein [Gemmatimonadaceae bacterium]|nr:DUF998 domain-containing protein [Gemmatimonadaceae bacterium]